VSRDLRLEPTRTTLHRIAAHVLGRRRHEVSGRFGLRPTPGGFSTPAFGDETETVRVVATVLVRETGSGAAYHPLPGATLRALAAFAGADIVRPFTVGDDTPAIGDLDGPLEVDAAAAYVLADWFALGARALHEVLASLPAAARPAVVQLWPEHFDLATNVGVGGGDDERVNLGASPGDSFCDEPYLYVGPWGAARPGDGSYWNAPFGAFVRRADVVGARDPVGAAVQFLRRGVARLESDNNVI
jgi:hypothetical protein